MADNRHGKIDNKKILFVNNSQKDRYKKEKVVVAFIGELSIIQSEIRKQISAAQRRRMIWQRQNGECYVKKICSVCKRK